MDDGTVLVRMAALTYSQAAQAVQDLDLRFATQAELDEVKTKCFLAIVGASREIGKHPSSS